MGREIRRVPPNWEHPRDDKGQYIPMYDDDFDSRLTRWLSEYELWKKGQHPDQKEDPERMNMKFWEWDGGPPDPESYRPKFDVEPTWFQVYETVSEGTPVTPPFSTKKELVDYLIQHGDFSDQRYHEGTWSKANAEAFVEREYAPSMLIENGPSGMKIKTPKDMGEF